MTDILSHPPPPDPHVVARVATELGIQVKDEILTDLYSRAAIPVSEAAILGWSTEQMHAHGVLVSGQQIILPVAKHLLDLPPDDETRPQVRSLLEGFLLAHFDEEMSNCMENLKKSLDEFDIEILCTFGPQSIDCVQDAVKKETGVTLADLATSAPPNSRLARGSTFLVGYQSMLSNMCKAGSPQNTALKAHFKCVKTTVDIDDNRCEEEARASFETYKQLKDIETCDSEVEDNKNCVVKAYDFACLAAKIHAVCGQSAFDAYLPIVRFSAASPYGCCSEGNPKELGTNFLDSLNMERSRKDLFRLVFGLEGGKLKSGKLEL